MRLGVVAGGRRLGAGDPILTLSPFARFRADSALTASGTTWTDSIGGRTLVSPAEVTTVSSVINGHPVHRLDGSTNYFAASTASDWTKLHDGNGFEIFLVCVPRYTISGSDPTTNRIYLSTRNVVSNSGLGFSALNLMGSSNLRFRIGNGSSAVVDSDRSGLATNTPVVVNLSYEEGESPEYRNAMTGQTTLSGSSANAPSSSEAPFPLHVGALSGGGNKAQIDIAELLIFARALSSEDRGVVTSYLSSRYGL